MNAKEEFLRKANENSMLKESAVSQVKLNIESFTSAFKALLGKIEGWLIDTPVTVRGEILNYHDKSIAESITREHGSLATYETLTIEIKHGAKTATIQPGGACGGKGSSPRAYLYVEDASTLNPHEFTLDLDNYSRKWTISQHSLFESDYRPEFPHQEELTEETFFRAIAPLA